MLCTVCAISIDRFVHMFLYLEFLTNIVYVLSLCCSKYLLQYSLSLIYFLFLSDKCSLVQQQVPCNFSTFIQVNSPTPSYNIQWIFLHATQIWKDSLISRKKPFLLRSLLIPDFFALFINLFLFVAFQTKENFLVYISCKGFQLLNFCYLNCSVTEPQLQIEPVDNF